jgi:Asp-tRNA(Asn)/Glu-tRNA(Gln) amidotransferase A subunit family amidase
MNTSKDELPLGIQFMSKDSLNALKIAKAFESLQK